MRAGLTGGLAVALAYLLNPLETLRKRAIKPQPPASVSLSAMSQLLWAAQGITRHPFRAAPSAGGTYPLEIYGVIGNTVDGIEPGVYHYLPVGHTLQAVVKENRHPQLAYAFDDAIHPLIMQSLMCLIIAAIYERTTTKYGIRGIQYVELEVGHVAQNILLQAISLGLTTTFLPRFNEKIITNIFATPNPLLVIPIGKSGVKRPIIPQSTIAKPKKFIPLPKVNSIDTMPVEETIVQRRSIRTYSTGELPLSKLSKILWAAQGVKNPETNTLAFPSMTKNPHISIYAILGQVDELKVGIYRYEPWMHGLEWVREGNFVPALVEAGLDQPWIRDAQVNFVITTDYQKVQAEFGELGERIAHIEVGQTAENIYLEAQVLGLGTVVIGAFHDSLIRSLLNLPQNQSPLYIIPLGLQTD